MSCPRAFIASVTTACSPPLAARPTSPPLVSCCISRRPGLPPTAALITAVHDPPLCAGIAVPRCSSSRSSHAPNRSVRPRLHRSRHEHPPLTRQIFPVGASSNQADTIAHAHCTGYRAFLYSPTATTRILPLRDCRPRCRGRRARSRHQASRAHCVRHILPVYIFLAVPIAGAAWALAERNRRWLYAVVVLLVFQAVSVLHAFPDYIAYTNEAFGGPANAYKYVSDSSADWGQQLKSVKRYLDARGVKNCWFAYFSQSVVD